MGKFKNPQTIVPPQLGGETPITSQEGNTCLPTLQRGHPTSAPPLTLWATHLQPGLNSPCILCVYIYIPKCISWMNDCVVSSSIYNIVVKNAILS